MANLTHSQSLPHNFGGLEADLADYSKASVLIWPVPVESTVSYGAGTRNGPSAIIDASRNVELFDEELGLETCGIGIHTLPPFTPDDNIDSTVANLHSQTQKLLDSGKFVCALGGEHSITGPIVRAYAERFPNLSVLQIDAHADLRDQYDGTPNSHASALRRVVERCPAVQVGIRSISKEESEALPTLNTRIFYAHAIQNNPNWIDEAVEHLTDTVYLTIDVDGFDPSIIPTTGTPEPGGLTWYQVMALLRRLSERRRVVGMDVVELSPMPNFSAPDFTIAKLIYKTLGYLFANQIRKRNGRADL